MIMKDYVWAAAEKLVTYSLDVEPHVAFLIFMKDQGSVL